MYNVSVIRTPQFPVSSSTSVSVEEEVGNDRSVLSVKGTDDGRYLEEVQTSLGGSPDRFRSMEGVLLFPDSKGLRSRSIPPSNSSPYYWPEVRNRVRGGTSHGSESFLARDTETGTVRDPETRRTFW